VYVGGKQVNVLRGRRLRSRVDLRGLPANRYTVRVVVTTTRGQRIVSTRRYRTCIPSAHGTPRSASAPAVLFAAGVDPQKFLYYCRILGARH
jgi:hypothetical protein